MPTQNQTHRITVNNVKQQNSMNLLPISARLFRETVAMDLKKNSLTITNMFTNNNECYILNEFILIIGLPDVWQLMRGEKGAENFHIKI
jgi:hypothetical protein